MKICFIKYKIILIELKYIFISYELLFLQHFTHTQFNNTSQWTFTCSKLTIETLEQGVNYVQSQQ